MTCFFLDFQPDSGRYVHQNRHEKLLRAILSNGTDAKQDKQCIVVYRNNNAKKLDVKNLMTVNSIRYNNKKLSLVHFFSLEIVHLDGWICRDKRRFEMHNCNGVGKYISGFFDSNMRQSYSIWSLLSRQ